MAFKKYLLPWPVLLCGLLASNVSAQVKTLWISPVKDAIKLDSLPVAVLSLHVAYRGKALQYETDYTMVEGYTVLQLKQPQLYDSLWVSYQTYPDWLIQQRQHQKPLYNVYGDVLPSSPVLAEKSENENEGDGIVTDGVLLRGISFGNAQDLVLNSSLNLRMYGKVGKDIEIEGAVTDQEYPFQPEGTTTTLQDFDRIYVAMRMPHISVLLGDHALISREGSRFMKYSKKNRGLQLSGKDTFAQNRLQWDASAALARGRFSRNEINGIEGLQGPYRLNGARGEQFVIVVSGTEVVYLDGVKMVRGLQADYVIDYNSGEITFTPKHIVNAFSRIVVEFQYSDRFYTRSVAASSVVLERNKASYLFSIYNEQDAKNQPIQQDLDAFDSTLGLTAREIMAQSGDNGALAVLPGARKIAAFSNTEPNYILITTDTVPYYLFVEQPDTFSQFYRVNFSYVGPGRGTYQITGTSSNGKVFKYVGKISGVPAGDYEPVSSLQTPNRLTMAEAGVTLKPRKGTLIRSNVSVSSNDKNTFSGIDDGNNNGIAGYLQILDRRSIGKADSVHQWYVQNTLQAEQTSVHFTTIERYRDVEFGREWDRSLYNPTNGTDPGNSGYIIAGTELGKGSIFAVYANAGMNRTKGRAAQNAKMGLRYRNKGFFFEPFALRSEGNLGGLNNKYHKEQADVGYDRTGNKVQVGVRQEQSLYSNAIGESRPENYGLREWNGLFQRIHGKQTYSLSALQRVNQNVVGFVLRDAVQVQNVNADFSRSGKKGSRLKFGLALRNMRLLDDTFKNLYSTENHVASRVEYQFAKWLNSLSGNVFYQSQSGREQQRQYSYFEVPAGQGFYTWVDFNGNGVKEVNEFQETQFKDQARYVRLLVPTGTYISAQGTEFTGNLLYQPSWEPKYGKLLNRLSWNYNGKSTATSLAGRLAPFATDVKSPEILSNSSFLRNLLEYQTPNNKWLFQYNVQNRASKLYFTNGFDLRNAFSQQLFFRGFIGSQWQLRLQAENKDSRYNSEYIPTNNFEYVMHSLEPYAAWQPGSRFRLGAFGKWQQYNGKVPASKVALLYEGGMSLNKAIGKGGMLELKASMLQANYLLPNGTLLSYDVLQGFSPGRNFRGTVDLRFNASKNIQMVMSYEGRKTGDVRMVHIGRAEARYLF